MNDPSMEALVAQARTALAHAVETAEGPDAGRRSALEFGWTIGDIGWRLAREPALRAKVQPFLDDTAETVAASTPLWLWIHEVAAAADPISTDPELYERALYLRSALEFFRDLYRDTAAREFVEGIQTDDIDQQLEALGRGQHVEAVPDAVPPSHRWWLRHAAHPG